MTRPVKSLSGIAATGDITHFGTNDLDQVNLLFTGQDQSATDPITMNTTWAYGSQKLQFRNPANSATATVINPAIATNANFQYNTPYDYYIFIDPDDGNLIKARNGRTGCIDSSHATNADVPLQAAIDALSAGSTLGTSGDNKNLWTGGKYGRIFVGPGTYYFHTAVILRSNIGIVGSGPMTTIFTWPDSLLLGNHNQDIFKSASWDTGSLSTTTTTGGETGVALRDFQIYGNWKNNVIPAANTATTTYPGGVETAGTDSWGHGIAFFGAQMTIDNVLVHGCPGAGIIIQGPVGATLGSGWTYPINPPNITGGTGTGMYQNLSYVTNVVSWANGRQGLLIRNPVYVHNYWSLANGEQGIDEQSCDYFTAIGWIDGIECFMDGFNHGDQYSVTYDQYGSEVRTTGGWITNAWIEAPMGCADNLMLGGNPSASSPTGWQIKGVCPHLLMSNAYLDHTRHAAVVVGKTATFCQLKSIYITANSDFVPPITYVNISPMILLGGFNNIETHFAFFQAGTNFSVTGLRIGDGVGGAAWNNLRITSMDNDYVLSNESTGNLNNIYAVVTSRGTQTTNILAPGGQTLSSLNTINIDTAMNTTSSIKSHNGGLATFSGNGSNTVFTIAHKLFAAPTVAFVNANTNDALGNFVVTYDATNVTVTYPIAPPSGTNNVKLVWSARVSP